MTKIHNFCIASESVKIKIHENNQPLVVAHVNNLKFIFLMTYLQF